MVRPLHISFNHYGALGHCDSHVSGPIPRRNDEDFRPGPVRILMRDGQRLQEPELVEACERQSRPTGSTWVRLRPTDRQAGIQGKGTDPAPLVLGSRPNRRTASKELR